MKTRLRIIGFAMLAACLGLSAMAGGLSIPHFSAALPTLPAGASELAASMGRDGIDVSFSRVLSSHLLVTGAAASGGDLDLSVRWLLPLDLVPVFVAVELAATHVTGLMTLFLGPVSLDLGRSWFATERWAIVQLSMHPRLTAVLALEASTARLLPSLGWRLFPLASARWELGLQLGTSFAAWTCWRFR